MSTGPNVTATFCATLADEWVRNGVTDVVVCPGSRSTPLALAVADEPGLRVHVHIDERSGGFMAVGLGLATGRPAVVVTTSGTAAAELHAAVVEAHQAMVPLIIATADRPPELQAVGAPQTIDQTHLFGRSTRWFAEPGVPDDEVSHTWRSMAARSVAAASKGVPGPVHLNLAFREPLVGQPGELPPGRDGLTPMVAVAAGRRGGFSDDIEDQIIQAISGARGIVVAGVGTFGDHEEPVGGQWQDFAERLGWPVIADPRSGVRNPGPTTVGAADSILRDPRSATRLEPDVILRIGSPPASKILNQWLDSSAAMQIAVDRNGSWIDPGHRLHRLLMADSLMVDLDAVQPADPRWLAGWMAAEFAAQQSIDEVLDGYDEPTEPQIARSLMEVLPEGASLVASSSMPVRDLEWYGRPRSGVKVLANRGANGIDGVTSSAVGVALGSTGPTALLIGDIAFLHDTNGLIGLAGRGVDLTIVVVDNRGGGIFSFLPQRAALTSERFEQLFGTPHRVDLAGLCAAHGLTTTRPRTAAEVSEAVTRSASSGGTHVVIIGTDRDSNVAVHEEIHRAVAASLGSLWA